MSGKQRGLRPGKPLFGALCAPASKSLAQRTLLIAALCGEQATIARLPTAGAAGDDVRRALDLIQSLGASLERPTEGSLSVRGVAPAPSRGWRANSSLDLGESGTLARLATAAAGLCGRTGLPIGFETRGSLLERSSPALFSALAHAGVRIEFRGREHGWPLTLWPAPPPARIVLDSPSSSQELSALLIAASAWPAAIEILVRGQIPSRPYVEMTVACLARFGATVVRTLDTGAESFVVRGPLRAPQDPVCIEPDASAAAVLLGAACISGGEISVSGLSENSLQGDTRIAEHLRAFGCRAGFDVRGLFAGGEVTQGARLDLSGEPDLAPVLAAVAARAALRHGAHSRLSGLGTLQGKESARIDVLAAGLAALGLRVSMTDTTLDIAGGRATSGPLLLDPRADHRMVFAFALLGLAREGIDVLGPDCVAKSWPGFWSELQAAGATLSGDQDDHGLG